MRLVWLLSFLGFVVLLTHGAARAQPSSADRVLATDLFQRGRAALVAGSYAEACPLLEESQRLDPAGGTLLNLALCHEQIGLVATAWSEFLEGLSVARREHREDRVRYASEHVAALEQRLSRLIVQLGDNRSLPGLSVELNGRPLSRSVWGVGVPVDPGPHTVRVRASGYRERTETVTVEDHGDLVTVAVAALEPEPVAEPVPVPAPAPAPASASVVRPPPLVTPPAEPPATHLEHRARRRRRAAVTLLAVGGAAAIAATVLGVRAIRLRRDAEDNCEEGRCSDLAFDQNDRARRSADGATALTVLSGATAGGSLWLWFSRTPRSEPGAAQGGLGIRGRF